MATAKSTKKYTFKCKPCYKFQSIEFEVKGNEEDVPQIIELYKRLIDELINIAPEQETTVKSSKNNEKQDVNYKPASEKQIAILKKFKINYSEGVSMSEAQELIKRSINNYNK